MVFPSRSVAWFLVFFGLLICTTGWAIPSADGLKLDIPVTYKGNKQNFTCLQDYSNPRQWYYIPNNLRLGEVADPTPKDKGTSSKFKTQPALSLVKFQAGGDSAQDIKEGGLLQFSMTLALPDGVQPQLVKGIAAAQNCKETDILLAPIEMNSCDITILTTDGKKLGADEDSEQPRPMMGSYANQMIPVQMNLSKADADLVEAALRSGGGVVVNAVFQHDKLSPRMGVKVHADLSKLSKHYSESSESKTRTANWNGWYRRWWGYYYGGENRNECQQAAQKVMEEMKETKGLTIEWTGTSSDTKALEDQFQTYLDPILNEIRSRLFDQEIPEKIEPAQAKQVADPNTPGYYWWRYNQNTNSSLAVKDISKSKSLVYDIDLSSRTLLKQPCSAGGLISLGNVSEEVQNRHIIVMPRYNWASCWFSLPPMGNVAFPTLVSADLTVEPIDPAGNSCGTNLQQSVRWTPDNPGTGWKDSKDNPRTRLVFPLADAVSKFKGQEDKFKYSMKWTIVYKMGYNVKKFEYAEVSPLQTGDSTITAPMCNLEVYSVKGKDLTWKGDKYDEEDDSIPTSLRGKPSQLKQVNVKILSTDKSKKPVTISSSISRDDDSKNLLLIVDTKNIDQEAPVELQVSFEVTGKTPKTLVYSDVSGRVMGVGRSSVVLTDDMYLEQ